MSTNKQVGNNTFEIPDNLEEPGWGEELSEYLKAIADALENVQNVEDILQTTALIQNNISSPTNINGLNFNVSNALGVSIDYYIRRVYNSGSSVLSEYGTIYGDYDGSTFTISRVSATGDAGVIITVTNAGQFQYTSSNLTDQTSGSIIFRAKTIITA